MCKELCPPDVTASSALPFGMGTITLQFMGEETKVREAELLAEA